MADSFDPATLAKFQKLQLMLAESPELVDALNNPELLALAALASSSSEKGKITKQQQDQPLPPVWEPEPEPNYPTIGCGHSDDVSVMSEMTTPTVMTKQPVPEEEFYPEVRKSGCNSSSNSPAAKNINIPPIQEIGANSYDDGVLPPPPSTTTTTAAAKAGGKTKNKVSQVRPNAARRAITRHRAQTTKAAVVPSKPMMKIQEDDVSSKSSSTESDLRASLLKRPPPLTARNGISSKSASTDDIKIKRYPSSAVGSSSSHSKSKNRSGTNGRGVKLSRSLPTKPVTPSSNHSNSNNRKRSGGVGGVGGVGGSSYGSSDDADDDDDDDDDIDISISVDLENDNQEEEFSEKSYPSPASSRSSNNSKTTTTTSSSRSDRVSDSSQPPAVTRRWMPPSKDTMVVPPAFRSMKSNSSHSQQQQKSKTISNEKVDIQTPIKATSYKKDLTKTSNNNNNNNSNSNTVVQSSSIRNSYHSKTPKQIAAANETKREVIGIESLKKTEKPVKVELVQKPKDNNSNNTITESLTYGGNNMDNNTTNLDEVKTYFASTQQRQGTTSRPNDYLPGTDPFSNSRKSKERAKKKYGSPISSGTSRVDEWLGSSGKKKERTWKVKEATA
jgi:hypothetical protein